MGRNDKNRKTIQLYPNRPRPQCQTTRTTVNNNKQREQLFYIVVQVVYCHSSCLKKNQLFWLCGDFFEPLAVAEDGHDGVEGVEARCERYLLVDVEHSADGIHDKPQEPLLGILLRQSPQGDHTQGCGETVAHGDAAVGPRDEYPVDDAPQRQADERHRQ